MIDRTPSAPSSSVTRLPPHSEESEKSLLGALLLLWAPFLFLAHRFWFLTDDAFISFRYAQNLLDGHGLVFNPGELVEGYSNLLWVLLVSFGMKLGLPALLWAGLPPVQALATNKLQGTFGTMTASLQFIRRREIDLAVLRRVIRAGLDTLGRTWTVEPT